MGGFNACLDDDCEGIGLVKEVENKIRPMGTNVSSPGYQDGPIIDVPNLDGIEKGNVNCSQDGPFVTVSSKDLKTEKFDLNASPKSNAFTDVEEGQKEEENVLVGSVGESDTPLDDYDYELEDLHTWTDLHLKRRRKNGARSKKVLEVEDSNTEAVGLDRVIEEVSIVDIESERLFASRWRRSSIMLKFLSINVNGLGGGVKRKWLKELKQDNRVNFLCIRESRISSFPKEFLCSSVWGGG
ncbi:hypothetical protein Ccrd_006670 [Cynara cardunculus var. scolymus]|uniref:Endonuclease/exonuclease/phosphatase n=1 Tax=Cynara cardunculus var. scolymus TaxID=59895 RepID=A0A118JUC3_CYNCS|nr:hypothetical protein Ccrd_006670 [Cynara cardunculus var. scolymus]